ncbi:MAG: hypothetical protein IGS48_21125 [Oscillatoriales cyanobacterium C42_A2020_001]|nr:hypothetical protein [Leptolyngbyaceae cyanobacterium C42_A2020_001]
MASKKSGKRLFCGMSYREVQQSNSARRSHLPKQDQQWLKENGYRNIGWDNVIKLHQKINDLLSTSDSDEPTLEELFLKADQIGSQYQTLEEIEAFNQALSKEVEAIANTIDQQFPDEEVEYIDYSQSSH